MLPPRKTQLGRLPETPAAMLLPRSLPNRWAANKRPHPSPHPSRNPSHAAVAPPLQQYLLPWATVDANKRPHLSPHLSSKPHHAAVALQNLLPAAADARAAHQAQLLMRLMTIPSHGKDGAGEEPVLIQKWVMKQYETEIAIFALFISNCFGSLPLFYFS